MTVSRIDHSHAHLWPTRKTLRAFISADRAANPRDPKAQLVLVLLRITQVSMGDRTRPRLIGKIVGAMYRGFTEMVLGMELRPKTRVGPGLSIYHGFGLVVNDHAVIGPNVVLRNGVTIGHTRDGGPVPVIGAGAQFGAGAIAIGGINIGDGAIIGAGAVVLIDVPAGAVAVGNPAVIKGSSSRRP